MVERLSSSAAAFESVTRSLDSLRPSLEEIPKTGNCYGCGSSAVVKAVIDYEYDWSQVQGTRFTIAKSLPGYRCESCQAEYRDSALAAKFLGLVAVSLAQLGHTKLQEALKCRAIDPHRYTTISDLPPSVESPSVDPR